MPTPCCPLGPLGPENPRSPCKTINQVNSIYATGAWIDAYSQIDWIDGDRIWADLFGHCPAKFRVHSHPMVWWTRFNWGPKVQHCCFFFLWSSHSCWKPNQNLWSYIFSSSHVAAIHQDELNAGHFMFRMEGDKVWAVFGMLYCLWKMFKKKAKQIILQWAPDEQRTRQNCCCMMVLVSCTLSSLDYCLFPAFVAVPVHLRFTNAIEPHQA